MDPQQPPHPGVILKERFLDPLGITPYRLARSIGVHVSRVMGIIKGDRAITADTAIRLGLFFNVPARWWLDMQAEHDTIGAPRVAELREVVVPCEDLDQILVGPDGARRLVVQSPHEVVTQARIVPSDLLARLRAQAALSGPRTPRVVEEVTLPNGARALTGPSG